MSENARAYLSDKDILVVSIPLAKMLGIAESIALRRIQHWLEFNEKHPEKNSVEHFHDGKWWVFNGYQGWADDIEIYSKSAIKRILGTLEDLGLLLSTSKYNKRKADRTKWYTIDYEAYDRFVALWHKNGEPVYNVGKQSKEYKSFIDQWTVTGIPVTGIPIDCDEHRQKTVTGIPIDRDSPSVTRESTDKTTDRTQNKDSAPVGADTSSKTEVEKSTEKKPRQPNPIFDAVKEHIFGITDGHAEGGRIGKISNWLQQKYEGPPGRKVGKISSPAKPEHIGMFVIWYKTKYPDTSLPRDFEKFVEHWREWGSSIKQPAADNKPREKKIAEMTAEDFARNKARAMGLEYKHASGE